MASLYVSAHVEAKEFLCLAPPKLKHGFLFPSSSLQKLTFPTFKLQSHITACHMFNSRKQWGQQLREEAPWPPAPRKYFKMAMADKSGPEGSAGLLPKQLPAGAPVLPLLPFVGSALVHLGSQKAGPHLHPLPEKGI